MKVGAYVEPVLVAVSTNDPAALAWPARQSATTPTTTETVSIRTRERSSIVYLL